MIPYFEDDKTLYMVTELCSGGDFTELNHGIDDYHEIRELYRDMVVAVAYCHDAGVAHEV